MCVVDAAMNSGPRSPPSPSRSVAWPPPFPYSSPASRLALKPSGLTIGTTIVRGPRHEVARARVAVPVAVHQLVRPLHGVLARGPLARVVHAELEERRPAVAGVHVRRDLDALDLAALVGLVVQRDRADQARVVPHQRLHVLAVVEQPPVGGRGRSAGRSARSPPRSGRRPRGPGAPARSGPGPGSCRRSCCRPASARRPRRTAPPRRSRGRRAPTGRARASFSWFFRSRLAVCTRTSDAFTFPVVSIGIRLDAQLRRGRAAGAAARLDDQSVAGGREARGHLVRALVGEPATILPSLGSMIARSQSPLADVRLAVISPPSGMTTRRWATEVPVRCPLVHDLSTALAAVTVCESSPVADAGAAHHQQNERLTCRPHSPKVSCAL